MSDGFFSKNNVHHALWMVLIALILGIGTIIKEKYIDSKPKEDLNPKSTYLEKKNSLATADSKIQEQLDLVKIQEMGELLQGGNVAILGVWDEKNKKYIYSKEVSFGDEIIFQVNIAAKNKALHNAKILLGNINNQIFSAGTSANISAVISAKKINPLMGSITLYFKTDSLLKYSAYKWNLKDMSKNNKSRNLALPNNQDGFSTINGGVLLGTIPENYRSNLLLKFIVLKP